ncbi:MAG: amidohydrolase family protein, partial [Planctomycetaceae bacterium]|nr:amidohydrolase family protein [Planctomycetaceae bacterium]
MQRSKFPAAFLSTWLISSLALGAIGQAAEPEHDLIVRNGRIVDGTGNPWFRGDVAIQGDRVVMVGRVPGAGKREIDAKGRIVSPGFIDMHSHSDLLLLEDGNGESKIRQGVTTEILGEGGSAGPYQGKLPPKRVTLAGETVQWTRLSGYFDAVEKAGISPNVASYVGLDNIWQCVLGQSFERPRAEQVAEMRRLVDEAMQDGALGLSSQLMMPPGSLATTDEIVELCKVV